MRKHPRQTVLRELPAPAAIADKAGTVRPRKRGHARDLDPALVAAMYADYLALGSLEKTGDLWGRSRQSMFELFKRRGLRLNAKMFLPVIEYRGLKFTEQMTCRGRRYLRATSHRETTVYLHHLVWQEANGPIPPGHKLAFRDGDHRNCALENLELLTNSEQVRRYACKGQNQYTVTARGRLALLMRAHAGGGTRSAGLKKGRGA